MGECGTGKTHLATGLCVAACRQKRRARFTTAANLVNELVEARQHNAVKRVLARWLRYDVIVLDEVGYVPLADIGAEFLFQVIAERAERASLIDHEPAVFRVDAGVPESPLVQGIAGSNHRSSAHHRNRRRVLPLSQNPGGATEKESIVGGCFYSAGQGKELQNAVPSPAPHPGWNRKTGQPSLLIQVGPNVSIKAGPNQVVKSTDYGVSGHRVYRTVHAKERNLHSGSYDGETPNSEQ